MAKIAFLHYRVGKTDGVSLQIESWSEILRGKGYDVAWVSGPVNDKADYVIDDLELQLDPKVYELNKQAFIGEMAEDQFVVEFERQKQNLVLQFRQMLKVVAPDVLWISNMFAVGEHLAAATALHQVLRETNQRVVVVHHDFYWENVRYKKPAYRLVEQVLEESFPPLDLNMKHVCINSIAAEELKKRRGIEAQVMPDALDFDYPGLDEYGSCKRELDQKGVHTGDLVVVQGTRIVRRKNIELAIDFVRELQKKLPQLHSKQRAMLVLAGYAEKRDEPYRDRLVEYAKEQGVELLLMPDVVSGNQIGQDVCGLYDIYRYADLITYPSEYEGFGNQFLEAMRAKKPVVMFEYPVFVKDIKPVGFEVISLGDRMARDEVSKLVKIDPEKIEEAVSLAVDVLNDEERYKLMVEKNFLLGKLTYGYEASWERMEELLR